MDTADMEELNKILLQASMATPAEGGEVFSNNGDPGEESDPVGQQNASLASSIQNVSTASSSNTTNDKKTTPGSFGAAARVAATADSKFLPPMAKMMFNSKEEVKNIKKEVDDKVEEKVPKAVKPKEEEAKPKKVLRKKKKKMLIHSEISTDSASASSALPMPTIEEMLRSINERLDLHGTLLQMLMNFHQNGVIN